jgi:stage IV sporulation protein FB
VENQDTEQTTPQGPPILPKPVLIEDRKNWVRRSLISLGIYIFVFMFIFQIEPIFVAAVLIALLIHELGHFFAMKAFNYTDVKLFIIPLLGAYVSGKKSLISQRQKSIVILAGPVPGIIIGFCLLISTHYYPNDRIFLLGQIFLALNFFNLLPFIPLDGGRLLEILFIDKNHIIRLVFTVISILFLLVFALSFKAFILLIVPVSMVFDLIMEIKNQKIRDYLKQENINYNVDYNDLPDKDYWIIRDCILLSFGRRYNGIQAGVHQYSVIEGGLVQHVSAIIKPPVIKDLKVLGKIIVFLIFLIFLLPVILYIPVLLASLNA